MRLYEVGTTTPFAGGGLTPFKPVNILPGGAYPGQKVFNGQKEEFRVVRLGSTVTVPATNSLIVQVNTVSSGATASSKGITTAQLGEAVEGQTEVDINGANLTPDKWAGGVLDIKGLQLPIVGNSVNKVFLATPLPFAIIATDTAILYVNPFVNCERGAADNEKVAGAALVTIQSGQFALVKTKGRALLDGAAIAAGTNELVKDAAGKVKTGTGEVIGHAVLEGDGAITQGIHNVWLDIA